MPLYERIMRLEDPKLPVHQFFGAMQEYALGNMTGAQAIAAFSLSPTEQTEAQTLLARIQADPNPRLRAQEFHLVLCLAEQRIPPYNTTAAVRTRLGV